jgi:hypothetical protein
MEKVWIIDSEEENGKKQITYWTTEELLNNQFDEDQLEELYDTELYISMCVNQWRTAHINDGMTPQQLIDLMTSDSRYMYNYKQTKEARSEFMHTYYKIIMKILGMDAHEAYQNVEQFYAFGPGLNLIDYSDEYYKEFLKLIEDISNGEKDSEVS